MSESPEGVNPTGEGFNAGNFNPMIGAVNARWQVKLEERSRLSSKSPPETFMHLTNSVTGERHRVILSGGMLKNFCRVTRTGWRVMVSETGHRTIVARTGGSKLYYTLAHKVLGLEPEDLDKIDPKSVIVFKNGDDLDYRDGNVIMIEKSINQLRTFLADPARIRLHKRQASVNSTQIMTYVTFQNVQYMVKGVFGIPGMEDHLLRVYDQMVEAANTIDVAKKLHERLAQIVKDGRANRPKRNRTTEGSDTMQQNQTNENAAAEPQSPAEPEKVTVSYHGITNVYEADGEGFSWLSVIRDGRTVRRVKVDSSIVPILSNRIWYYYRGFDLFSKSERLTEFVAQSFGMTSPRDGHIVGHLTIDTDDFRVGNVAYMSEPVYNLRMRFLNGKIVAMEKLVTRRKLTDDPDEEPYKYDHWRGSFNVGDRNFSHHVLRTIASAKKRVVRFLKECSNVAFSVTETEDLLERLTEVQKRFIAIRKPPVRVERDEQLSTSSTTTLGQTAVPVDGGEGMTNDCHIVGPVEPLAIPEAVTVPPERRAETVAVVADEPKHVDAQWTDSDEAALMDLIDRKQAHLEQSLRHRFDVLRNIARMKI